MNRFKTDEEGKKMFCFDMLDLLRIEASMKWCSSLANGNLKIIWNSQCGNLATGRFENKT